MPGNGKVFVCHAAEDAALCQPVLTALDAWGITYFFESPDAAGASAQLSDQVQQAVAEHDLFLRICTAALQRSLTASYEVNAFRSLQAEDKRRGRGDRRALVNLILDRGYMREPIDSATLFVDATGQPRPAWLAELGRALGAGTAPRRFSRRSLFAYGATAVVGVAAVGAGGGLALDAEARAAAQPTYLVGQTAWHLSGGRQVPPLPAAADGVVYTIDDTTCAAYQAATGRDIWRNTGDVPRKFASSAVVDNGVAYYGVDATIVALRTRDGQKRWRWGPDDGGDQVGAGSAADGTVYILSNGGTLYAVDAASGHTRWSVPVGEVSFDANTSSYPIAAGGKVYLGLLDTTVRAFDAANGKPVWKVATRGAIYSTPSILRGVVYIGSIDGALYALDADRGTLRWKYQTGGGIYGPPVAQDGIVFVGSHDGSFYAVEAAGGRAFWGTPVGPQIDGFPVVVGTNVYVMIERVVSGFRVIDGEQVLVHRTAGKDFATELTTTGGLLIYGTSTNPTSTTPPLHALYAIGG